MIINQDKQDKDTKWKIGNMEIQTTEHYTYLGEIIDSKNSMEKHISEKRRRAVATTRKILALSKEETLKKVRSKFMLELYERCVVSSLLYGCENWNLKKKQIQEVEQIQAECL